MIKAYLGGTITEIEYRTKAKLRYGKLLHLVDPFEEVESLIMGYDLNKVINKELTFTEKQRDLIVVGDKEIILTCDILIAYMNKFTCGTIMEIMHAWNNKIPVYVINPKQTLIEDVWLSYHTTLSFSKIDGCFEYILSSVEDSL